MHDDLKKLREAMTAVGGHLQDLQSEQRATTRELGVVQQSVTNLQARSVHLEAALAALGGTFASIEQILGNLLQAQARFETVADTVADLAKRVERLEQKAS